MFEVLTSHGADAIRWQSIWDSLPHYIRDVHYTPAYARVQETLGGTAHCAVYQWDAWTIMQPFMLRDIGETGYRDITSMYGHGGPLSNMRTSSAKALAEWSDLEFARWRGAHNVVAEFCQLHPMLVADQDRLIHPAADVRHVRDTVSIRVDCTDDLIISGMRAGRRYNIERRHIVENWAESCLPEFMRLYDQTMDRREAAATWRFASDYFAAHFRELWPDRMVMMFSDQDGWAVSAGIFLFGHHHAHYQFAGNVENPRGANDCLVMEAARLARRAGCTWLMLGGGTTAAADDGLFQFKAGFSKHRFPSRVYRRVFDRDAYERLCREAGRDHLDMTGYFPAYRVENAA